MSLFYPTPLHVKYLNIIVINLPFVVFVLRNSIPHPKHTLTSPPCWSCTVDQITGSLGSWHTSVHGEERFSRDPANMDASAENSSSRLQSNPSSITVVCYHHWHWCLVSLATPSCRTFLSTHYRLGDKKDPLVSHVKANVWDPAFVSRWLIKFYPPETNKSIN